MPRLSRNIFAIIFLTVIWWCAEAAIEAWYFSSQPWTTILLYPSPGGLTLRLLGIVAIVTATILSWLACRHRENSRVDLRTNENRYRDLVENCPDSIIVYRDNHVLYMNGMARDFLQVGNDTPLESLSVTDFIHPDDQNLSRQRRTAILEGSPGGLPPIVRLVLPDSTAHSTMVNTCRIDYAGKPALLSFCRDVTKQMAGHSLAMSQERLSLALEAARDGAWDWDMVTNRLHYNEAWAGMLGLPPFSGEHTPETWLQLVHPDDKERSLKLAQAHARGETPSYENEVRLQHADGHYIWVLDRGRVVERAADGTPLRMAGTHRDITARKRAEIALEARNQIAEVFLTSPRENIFENILPAIGAVTDSPTVLLALLETGHRLHLTSQTASDGGATATHVWDEYLETMPAVCHRVLEEGEPTIPDTPIKFEPLGQSFAQALIVPIRSQGRSLGFLVVAERALNYGPDDTDVLVSLAAYLAPILAYHLESASKESQLRQAQKMEAVGALAGGIAHDFNNILQAILGFSTLAFEEAQNMESRAGNFIVNDLERVVRATQRGRELVERILLFSRRPEQDHTTVDMAAVVTETVDLLTNMIPATIEVRLEITAGCEPVLADPTQISQVLVNLATNSFHAMEDQGGTLTFGLRPLPATADVSIVPDELVGRDLVVLSVTDTGCGIDEATLERLYDPFFTTKEVGKGTGLGLSVVHGIITGHGGKIVVDSTVGQGTNVQIFLPTITERPDAETKQEDSTAPMGPASPAPKPGRILFVDDEADIAALGEALLVKQGHRVTAHTDSREALESLRSAPQAYDLLITDLTMPHLTGLQLADAVGLIRPELPIVLITGVNEKPATAYEEHPQIRGLLHKPFGGDTLRETVDRALMGSEPEPG